MPAQHISSRSNISWSSFLKQSLLLLAVLLVVACAGPVSNTAPAANKTAQLYFPGEPRNDSDGIFSPELLMHVQSAANGQVATFNFVLALH